MSCRVDQTKQWAVRCVHEASLHERSCFVTLTYNDDNLPDYGALRKDHLQKWLRSLRKRGLKFRYFACGEYGEKLQRPHYHVLLFGLWPSDAEEWAMRGGYMYYRSEIFESAWTKGYVEFSDVSRGNCEYVAGYIRKKLHGKKDETYWDHYERSLPDGTLFYLPEEFALQSTKPAIGKGWLEKYWQEVYQTDSIVLDGREWPVPEYYDKWLKDNHPDVWDDVRLRRMEYAKSDLAYEKSHPNVLRAKDINQRARVGQQTRSYEK